jgi:hypothetical protein
VAVVAMVTEETSFSGIISSMLTTEFQQPLSTGATNNLLTTKALATNQLI